MTKPLFSWRHAILESDLPPVTRHVLLTLSCHMTDVGESCYPSIDTLAQETGLSRKSVITHLKLANERGWIKVGIHGFRGQRWRSHEYSAAIPEPGDDARNAAEAGEPDSPPFCAARGEVDPEAGELGSPPPEKVVNLRAEGGEPQGTKVVNDVHPNSTDNSTENAAGGCARARAIPEDPPPPRPPDPDPPPWLAEHLRQRGETLAEARAAMGGAGGAFAMHPGWQPGPQFADRCAMAGTPAEFSEEQLGEFVSYWSAEGAVARHGQWEHRFLKHLRRQAAQPQGDLHGARRSARGPCPADIVNDTSWLDDDAIAYVESGLELARRGRPGEPGV